MDVATCLIRQPQPELLQMLSPYLAQTCSFVIKTAEDNGGKVFINVCQSDAVPMPGSWSSGVLPDHVSQALERASNVQELADQEFEALRLPMGCGDLRADTDKKGMICSK
jgi:hypothetical protein